jgi:hypothetical protein
MGDHLPIWIPTGVVHDQAELLLLNAYGDRAAADVLAMLARQRQLREMVQRQRKPTHGAVSALAVTESVYGHVILCVCCRCLGSCIPRLMLCLDHCLLCI